VEIKAALTCGTDLKTHRRGHPVLVKEVPSTFGHETAGVIAELGPGAEDLAVG
jgi:L-iditol 2-dehydrogenase